MASRMVRCYFTNQYIGRTAIYVNGSHTYTGCYGDEPFEQMIEGAVYFVAVAATGGLFTHWEYRVGNTGSQLLYANGQTIGYDGAPDIWIRAEGESEELVTRPSIFHWTYKKQSGAKFMLNIEEWNALMENINRVRKYRKCSQWAFEKAIRDQNFTAKMYNDAVDAIQDIGEGAGGFLSKVKQYKDEVTAERLNLLVSELNVIT